MAMHVGLALPNLDLPGAGGSSATWPRVQDCASRAEGLGFESLWLADHGFDPLVALGALARVTDRVRLGTLGMDVARRPAAVLAKALATIDVVSGGRLVVGLGPGSVPERNAGSVPERNAGSVPERNAGEPACLAEVCQVLVGLFDGGPFSFAGAYATVTEARCLPLPVTRPHPPIWVGGSTDGLLDVVAGHADGWFTTGAWTLEAYRGRLVALDAACDRAGRDPAGITRAVGLSALVGENETDLRRRFRRLGLTPSGTTLDEWRRGRLVGTVEAVGDRLEEWEALGVDTVVLGAGGVAFSPIGTEDLAILASACSLEAV